MSKTGENKPSESAEVPEKRPVTKWYICGQKVRSNRIAQRHE